MFSKMHTQAGKYMRTTLDIDRDLLERVKTALGAATYTEGIEEALTMAIGQSELEVLLESIRGRDPVWSHDEMRAFRRTKRDVP